MEIGSKKIAVVAGGTGLIGSRLIPLLQQSGFYIRLLTRNPDSINIPEVEVIHWNTEPTKGLLKAINNSYVVVNLAGSSIATLWTKKNKQRIINSRINSTRSISWAIENCETPPKIFVQASAVGIYPYSGNQIMDETYKHGNGFLAELTEKWEEAALKASGICRVILLRTGIVLAKEGGFLLKIAKPAKNFAGIYFGKGNQQIPWIHIDDHVQIVLHLINNPNSQGAYNLVAPNPENLKTLVKEVNKQLKRKFTFSIPTTLLQLLLGNFARETLLASQHVVPKRLLNEGFQWKHPTLQNALENLIS